MIVKDVMNEINNVQLNAKYMDDYYMTVINDEHISSVFATVSQELLRYAKLLSSLPVDFKFDLKTGEQYET